jgi:hypothetical protein
MRNHTFVGSNKPLIGMEFLGSRTENLVIIDPEFHDYICKYVLDKLLYKTINNNKIDYNFEYDCECYFSYTTKQDYDMTQDSHNMLYHTDNSTVYAGVLYLNKNPIDNNGTIVIVDGNKEEINNNYNRFACYKSNLVHSPAGGYGTDVNDARLVMVMFFNSLKLNLCIKEQYTAKYFLSNSKKNSVEGS